MRTHNLSEVSVCRWDMSSSSSWDGTAFPEAVVSSIATVTTQESALHFAKPADRSALAGVQWPPGSELAAPFAARARGYACSAANAWQQIELEATPGTQLRINGVTVAESPRGGSATPFRRGPPSKALFFHWLEPGCVDVDVLFYEPPFCGANHVEQLSGDSELLQVHHEAKVAYSDTSTVLCADIGCRDVVALPVGGASKALKLRVTLIGDTLTQTATMLTADGAVDEQLSLVRRVASALANLCIPPLGASLFFAQLLSTGLPPGVRHA